MPADPAPEPSASGQQEQPDKAGAAAGQEANAEDPAQNDGNGVPEEVTDLLNADPPRPSFTESFGPELETSMARARELLITGITRNGLVNSYYNRLENLLAAGCQIRFVLTDPDSDAIGVAASRYYAERSRDSASARTRHTLRLLTELRNSAGDAISVRLSTHPLATGIIAVDTTTTTPASAVFAECYSYQAPGDLPKFVLQPEDGRWFTHFTAEAERLWASGQPYPPV